MCGRGGGSGVSFAVFPLRATVAATALPPLGVRVKLLLVIVEASIAREKVAVGAMLVATAVAPFAGVFAVTVGAAVTGVKLQETGSVERRVGAERTIRT